jgi:hypothetical protein
MRDRMIPAGATPHLPAHYRPWPCPPSADTATLIGAMHAWRNLQIAVANHAILEANDTRRDGETERRFAPRWNGRRWRWKLPKEER